MIIPMKYTHFGWKFLSKVDYKTLHSGVDLNFGAPYQDEGLPILAMADGIVQYENNTGSGWGNLVVIFHPTYNVWSRYGHLKTRSIKVGETVLEGQEIGTCGRTGGNWAPHLHWDVIKKKLPAWTSYTSWWSKSKVLSYYINPISYVNGINAAEKESEKQEVSPWAKESVQKCKDLKVATYWDYPQKEIGSKEVRIMLNRVGLIKNGDPNMPLSKEEFAVALDRAKQLDQKTIDQNKLDYFG